MSVVDGYDKIKTNYQEIFAGGTVETHEAQANQQSGKTVRYNGSMALRPVVIDHASASGIRSISWPKPHESE